VAEPGQRRKLEAILSADVVGYSRLMQDDDAATVETLTKYRAIFSDFVNRHDGRIVDSPGDNILAEFDSPVEAVQCAIELQREFARRNLQLADHRKMQFRIGINLGDILSRDDGTIYGDGVNVAARLESLAEPGGIMISESARMQVRSLIDVSIADAGEHEVKNIVEPVHVYQIVLDGSAPKPQKLRKVPRAMIAATAVVVLVIAIVVGVGFRLGGEPDDPILTLPDGPAIAVIPFDNVSGDPEQDYFSTGLTEDLITQLSRLRTFFVIARDSTKRYKSHDIDVREVGRDLGARYVVVGSVRKGGDTVRVAVQLLDAGDGTQLWGEIYDRELTAVNLFEVQDEITSQVASIIADSSGIAARADIEASRSKPTESLDAYECLLRQTAYYDVITPHEHLSIRECMERAVKLEPDWAPAWVGLAWTYLDEDRFGFNPQPGSLERALTAAQRAVELDKNNDEARRVLAAIHFHRHELDLFYIHAERALEINPNNSTSLADLGDNMVFAGNIDRGIALVRKAIALNPYHPDWYYFSLTEYHYRRGEYEAALDMAQKINMPNFFWTHVHRARAYGQLNRKTGAAKSIEKLIELYPDYPDNARLELRKYNYPEAAIEHSMEGLRKAGLDIPDEEAAAN
jgi:adenylate cyclase